LMLSSVHRWTCGGTCGGVALAHYAGRPDGGLEGQGAALHVQCAPWTGRCARGARWRPGRPALAGVC
jgi:hypothetical protein